ncbi:hypothetical protein ACIBI9_18495 [Nonomuraea sp. NPDC050451]|uniref:hypothetical protein n=1 Tax=Nonomuraea sp. NPDC050451 TaxID=3364364 RepID=UPI00378EE9CB
MSGECPVNVRSAAIIQTPFQLKSTIGTRLLGIPGRLATKTLSEHHHLGKRAVRRYHGHERQTRPRPKERQAGSPISFVSDAGDGLLARLMFDVAEAATFPTGSPH